MRRHRTRDRSSPFPIIIAIGAVIIGFVLMRLILDIQRIAPREQMVGVPQPTSSESAQRQAAPPQPQAPAKQTGPPPAPQVVQTPAATIAPIAQAPSRAPSQAAVAVVEATKKPAPAVSTPAPSIAIPEAFVPAFAKANPAAKASVAPIKEPEVRRAEPVRPEDLASAAVNQNTSEGAGPNRIAIKPLKKTYIKVVVDNESLQPAFERWISPADGTVEFRGQKVAVRVLDRDAIQIKKNGKPISEDDGDVTVE